MRRQRKEQESGRMESGDHLEKEESLYEPFPLVQVKEQEKNLIWTHTKIFFTQEFFAYGRSLNLLRCADKCTDNLKLTNAL